jgi:hypothetical protein
MEPQNPYQSISQQKTQDDQVDEHEKPSAAQVHAHVRSEEESQHVLNPYVQSLSQPTMINPDISQEPAVQNVAETGKQVQDNPLPSEQQLVARSSLKKPAMIKTIIILDALSAITHALLGLVLLLGGITFLLGIYAWVVAGFSAMHMAKLGTNPPNVTKPDNALVILQLVSLITGNLLSVAIGIIKLIIHAQPETKAFYQQLAQVKGGSIEVVT